MSQLRFGYVFLDHVPPISPALSKISYLKFLNFDCNWRPAHIPDSYVSECVDCNKRGGSTLGLPENPLPIMITSRGLFRELMVESFTACSFKTVFCNLVIMAICKVISFASQNGDILLSP